jgi:hypothetical protein
MAVFQKTLEDEKEDLSLTSLKKEKILKGGKRKVNSPVERAAQADGK